MGRHSYSMQLSSARRLEGDPNPTEKRWRHKICLRECSGRPTSTMTKPCSQKKLSCYSMMHTRTPIHKIVACFFFSFEFEYGISLQDPVACERKGGFEIDIADAFVIWFSLTTTLLAAALSRSICLYLALRKILRTYVHMSMLQCAIFFSCQNAVGIPQCSSKNISRPLFASLGWPQ